MKSTFLPAALCASALVLVGCGDSTSPSTTSAPTTTSAPSVASVVTNMAAAVTNATASLAATTAEVAKKVDAAVAQAQSFLGQGQFQSAMSSLTNLSSLALSAEQLQTVAGVKTQIETAMKAAGQAVDVAKTAANEAAAVVQTKVNAAVTQATALLKEGKFQDALASLKGLSDLSLTAEQTKLVNDLKTQIQTAMAATQGAGADTLKAAGDLFKKK